MQEEKLRALITQVKEGTLCRRAFVQQMLVRGLTTPLVTQMLSYSDVAIAQDNFVYRPSAAGGGGHLGLLFWQAPTLLNPHFAAATRDQEASRIFYEPLAGWDEQGFLVPILASEVPSLENGGLSRDGMFVTWKLQKGVVWHDGTPFTADDCVFTWEYASDVETSAFTWGTYSGIRVEKINAHTIQVIFSKPTPNWADAFVGARGMIIPKHHFEAYKGERSREAPANFAPIGTGAYKIVDFKMGDFVKGERNPKYHVENRPYFDSVEIKGGGDSISAARAVLQTGEYDFAWNLQVENDILEKLENGGKGQIKIVDGGNIEHIQLNTTDPWTEVDGERSSIKTKHPTLSDKAVRDALNLLVDRGSVERFIYGRTGVATANFINGPERYRSKNSKFEFNIEKANQILDAAGWRHGPDGVREKDGKRLTFVFQTSINAPRQKTQAIVKRACQKAGIDVQLKAVTPSAFFSGDVANIDTFAHFACDLQMYTSMMTSPDPQQFMIQFTSAEVARAANKWRGRNITRWRSEAYDATYHAAEGEMDPVKRAALLINLNDLVINDRAVIPVVYRPMVAAIKSKLRVHLSGWDSSLWLLSDWYREA
jgi:peptide/nickel transport system substrate-binding protein